MKIRWLLILCVSIGCGGGDTNTSTNEAEESPAASEPTETEPQLPAARGDLIGLPGAAVPGLEAFYVTTELGWLGPDDDVVFEAVIQWQPSLELGCGILRRGPDGNVNTVLMQGQLLPGTGGGRVKHPQLPLEARGDTLVIPALVEGGTITRGLFGVSKGGGTPVLLAAEENGEFVAAEITAAGDVIAEVAGPQATSILVVPAGGQPTLLCDDCAPGFSTDGECVVVRRHGRAVAVELDGTEIPLLGAGDPAPGTAGLVTGVRSAWVTQTGAFVVHVTTDDDDRPDVLVRLDQGGVDVLAACGAAAPGTNGVFATLDPAAGRSADVVFGATLDGDPAREAAVFCARPGATAELLAATGDPADGIDALLAIRSRDVIAGTAFGAVLFKDGAEIAQGVFRGDGARVVTTNAPVEGLAAATVSRFLYPVRDAVHAKDDGRTLVHVGIVEERRPDATLGALLLVR